jgi:hypothetical protein
MDRDINEHTQHCPCWNVAWGKRPSAPRCPSIKTVCFICLGLGGIFLNPQRRSETPGSLVCRVGSPEAGAVTSKVNDGNYNMKFRRDNGDRRALR